MRDEKVRFRGRKSPKIGETTLHLLGKNKCAPENFELPFSGKLSPDNRWVIMAEFIPWSEFETEYAEKFSEKMGAPAKPFRMALGALIIKEKLGTSDRETIEP